MMKDLLEHNFISHYKLTASVTVSVVSTTDINFDLTDDDDLVYPSGKGVAKYSNPSCKEVNIINYEAFFKKLPQSFQDHKNNCDLIVYTSDNQCFLLNELTDTGKKKGKKRAHAIKQMLQSLQHISEVSEIRSFITNFQQKRCCYFNKKSQSPSVKISAPATFGKLNDIAPHGFKMSNSGIESLGFELWEFSGSQTYLLEDTPFSLKSIAEQLNKLSTKEVKELTEIISLKSNITN